MKTEFVRVYPVPVRVKAECVNGCLVVAVSVEGGSGLADSDFWPLATVQRIQADARRELDAYLTFEQALEALSSGAAVFDPKGERIVSVNGALHTDAGGAWCATIDAIRGAWRRAD